MIDPYLLIASHKSAGKPHRPRCDRNYQLELFKEILIQEKGYTAAYLKGLDAYALRNAKSNLASKSSNAFLRREGARAMCHSRKMRDSTYNKEYGVVK